MKKIKSDNEVSVLVDRQSDSEHSTTIKYGGRRFKLVSNHYNGYNNVYIYLFSEVNGWVVLYDTDEINDVVCNNYVFDINEKTKLSIANYYAMVKHLKKVFG